MAYPYIGKTEVELRLGRDALRRLYDENRDGFADDAPLLQLAKDASARVKGALRAAGRYNLDAIDAAPSYEVIRLALDVAEYYACLRYPEVMRKNVEFLERMVSKELADLVSGKMQLDGAVDPIVDEAGTEVTPGTVWMATDADRGW